VVFDWFKPKSPHTAKLHGFTATQTLKLTKKEHVSISSRPKNSQPESMICFLPSISAAAVQHAIPSIGRHVAVTEESNGCGNRWTSS